MRSFWGAAALAVMAVLHCGTMKIVEQDGPSSEHDARGREHGRSGD